MAARRARVLRDQQEGGHAQALRRHLIGVTQRLLAAHGLTGLTTRSIAREAEVSDGVLYNHFAGKDDLVVTALAERLAEITSRLRRACPRAGAQDLRTGLTALVQLSHEFQAEALPLIGGLITHPELVRELLVRFHTGDAAPQLLWQEVCDYLAGEQELGTASLAVEPQLIAEIIFSTGHFRVLADVLAGHQGTAWAGDQLPEPQTERLVTFLLRACAVDPCGQR